MNARRRIAKRRGWPDNLYQKVDGYFWYRNPQNGKTKGLGRDRVAAFEEARKANAALASLSKSTLAEWATGKQQTSLADWIPLYKQIWLEREKPAKSTLTAVSDYLKYIGKADFAWMQLPDITAQHISDYIDRVEKQRSANVAILIRTRLSDMFRTAETKGLIGAGKNPVTVTYIPEVIIKRDRLSLEQFKQIRAAAPPWLANAMNLAVLTGQRREDLTEMKFSDVRDGFLHVVQGKSQGETKIRMDVRISLSALDMSIEDAIRQCRDAVVSKYLVHHNKTQATHKAGDKVAPAGLTNAFARTRNEQGITPAEGRTPPTFHELRSLSERLYREQYGAEFAQSILGHKNAKMTATYDDLRGSAWQEIAAK
jgi:integrase